MSEKYFRTPHLPYSPGGTNDDRRVSNDEHLSGNIVITEKMDGSNVCLTRDAVYARSHSKTPKHPSFDALKAFHAKVKGWFNPNTSYFGEWCIAKHSVAYTALPAYFLLFGVRRDDDGVWLPWEEVVFLANYHDFKTVPVLWQGTRSRNLEAQVEELLERHPRGLCGAEPETEGLVVRTATGWHQDDAHKCIAKWVRANHVQTDEHWTKQAFTKNLLAK